VAHTFSTTAWPSAVTSWRTYRFIAFMGSDGELKEEDLGVLHSSAAESMQALVQARLRQRDEITDSLAATRIAQNWPKGLIEWTTKAVRDAVYASPVFTRLLRADALKESIARGVRDGLFGYAAKRNGEFVGIKFNEPLDALGVEFSADVVLVPESLARQLKDAQPTPEVPVPAEQPTPTPVVSPGGGEVPPPIFTSEKIPAARWEGEVPAAPEVDDLLYESPAAPGPRRGPDGPRRVRCATAGRHKRRAHRGNETRTQRARPIRGAEHRHVGPH
jgi:hypothetical protein